MKRRGPDERGAFGAVANVEWQAKAKIAAFSFGGKGRFGSAKVYRVVSDFLQAAGQYHHSVQEQP
jgi:hypothetical protein